MYEAFYNLREKPFAILPDPDYLDFGERHTLAYTVLRDSRTSMKPGAIQEL